VEATPRISRDLAGFLESGLAIVVATRDSDLQPDGTVGWAVRAHEDGEGLTLFMHEQAAAEMLRNLARHPEIAINLDQPSTHRACQVKGVYLSHRKATEADRPTVDGQVEGFARELAAIGIPLMMCEAWQVWPATALELRVTRLFEQTPGPGTGEPLP
jgi:Pyridoxamine 5'-phosphate oxidase